MRFVAWSSRGTSGVVAVVVLWVVVALVAVGSPSGAVAGPSGGAVAGQVSRLAGSDRFATAAAVSSAGYAPGVPVVYVATGGGFADALTGGPAAARSGGPILLVTRDGIPAATANELQRLQPGAIVVLGGTAVVSDAVQHELGRYTDGQVSRLAGSDRFRTAVAVSQATFEPDVPVAFIATGGNFPDALAGGPVAGRSPGPILLVTPGSVPAATGTELTRLQPRSIVILGGSAVVSETVADHLERYTAGSVARWSGSDRYATAADITARSFSTGASVVYVATGANFPDALAGGPLAATFNGPILLVDTGSIPAPTATELARLNPTAIVILGGTAVVSPQVQQQLARHLPGSGGLPGVPVGWPSRVELGLSNVESASSLRASAPFGFRYQYLAGGVNTGNGWASWNPDGTFVTNFANETQDAGMIPVFSYYMLYQSEPGVSQSEADGLNTNLNDASTMAAYYDDLKLLFQRANEAGGTVVLHVEPDLWAYLQQAATGDDGATVAVKVDASGQADVAGLADTAAGFAQAIVRLRDSYGPNVILGYHFSAWGTGTDIIYSDPSDSQVEALGVRTADFYGSLGADFDVAFTDLTDRDAAFKQYEYGDGGASWYTADDYRRSTIYIGAFVANAGLRAVLWQLPLGNTVMRAMDNTWGHYQDNKVETLLDDPARAQLDAYTQAGVIAYLFGAGAGGATCACDGEGDGITNPAPINGNDRDSLSADDDGGFFRDRAANYYTTGPTTIP